MKKSAPFLVLAALLSAACSSTGPVKSQAYAKLSDHRAYEYEFPVVWNAIEKTLKDKDVSVDFRNPAEVDDVKLRELHSRTLDSNWIYSQSRDKYMEYKLNGFPKKQYLQERFKYRIKAETQMGGTLVTVGMDEEIEKLKADGSSAGFSAVDHPDTSRTNELLDRIQNTILAAVGSG